MQSVVNVAASFMVGALVKKIASILHRQTPSKLSPDDLLMDPWLSSVSSWLSDYLVGDVTNLVVEYFGRGAFGYLEIKHEQLIIDQTCVSWDDPYLRMTFSEKWRLLILDQRKTKETIRIILVVPDEQKTNLELFTLNPWSGYLSDAGNRIVGYLMGITYSAVLCELRINVQRLEKRCECTNCGNFTRVGCDGMVFGFCVYECRACHEILFCMSCAHPSRSQRVTNQTRFPRMIVSDMEPDAPYSDCKNELSMCAICRHVCELDEKMSLADTHAQLLKKGWRYGFDIYSFSNMSINKDIPRRTEYKPLLFLNAATNKK